jgi:hypothetical protein
MNPSDYSQMGTRVDLYGIVSHTEGSDYAVAGPGPTGNAPSPNSMVRIANETDGGKVFDADGNEVWGLVVDNAGSRVVQLLSGPPGSPTAFSPTAADSVTMTFPLRASGHAVTADAIAASLGVFILGIHPTDLPAVAPPEDDAETINTITGDATLSEATHAGEDVTNNVTANAVLTVTDASPTEGEKWQFNAAAGVLVTFTPPAGYTVNGLSSAPFSGQFTLQLFGTDFR